LNPLHAIDFYKAGHRQQYPKGTTFVYSNFTPRSNKLSNLPDNNDSIVFFGLQYFIVDFLINKFNSEFFQKDKAEVVAKYKRRMDTSLGKDAIPVDHIEALHDLGYLPLYIHALPEGSKVPMGVPCLTIHNTKPEFFWLVNYIESVMSAYLWKMSTSATTANWYKQLFTKYAEDTGADVVFTNFQGHDFSFRGCSGLEDATMSGAAHLTSFFGTDTVSAIDLLEEFYDADCEKELVGCSVPATEHSVMCLNSKETELETFKRLITEVYPAGIVSIVSDTWDYWKVLTEYLPTLKTEIMARDGKVVIRPDSGDPVKIVAGYRGYASAYSVVDLYDMTLFALHEKIDHEYGYNLECVIYNEEWYDITDFHNPRKITEAEAKGSVAHLYDVFGGTVNSKGYQELDSHIGLIYGDSITPQRAQEILHRLKDSGFASTNVVFGIGSFTYQHVTRDTYGFAVKATYGEVNDEGRAIQKDPATDTGKTKKSACGLLKVVRENGKLVLKDNLTLAQWGLPGCELRPVFADGVLFRKQTLKEIRENVSKSI